MAWSDAARRAAAEARRRRSRLKRTGPFWRKEDSDLRRDWEQQERKAGRIVGPNRALVNRATDYTGSTRSQLRSINALVKKGRDPRTGKKVGKRRARAAAAHIGDWANE